MGIDQHHAECAPRGSRAEGTHGAWGRRSCIRRCRSPASWPTPGHGGGAGFSGALWEPKKARRKYGSTPLWVQKAHHAPHRALEFAPDLKLSPDLPRPKRGWKSVVLKKTKAAEGGRERMSRVTPPPPEWKEGPPTSPSPSLGSSKTLVIPDSLIPDPRPRRGHVPRPGATPAPYPQDANNLKVLKNKILKLL